VYVEQENIVCTLNWTSVIAKKQKKSLFYEEKSLVGLTPEDFIGKFCRFPNTSFVSFKLKNER
jgi:hypothetical protein